MQKHRIYTNIGKDQKVTVELKQDYDLLEILSLKFTQQQAYDSFCADYGVVCGRISVNNGLGIPNVRVSIFVPLTTEHEDDPVMSKLYPYKAIGDKNDNGYRYNLLPSRKQHGGHEPTGTFPDQIDINEREEILEVFETYYKYTAKTNDAGDFMIWGVPLGTQTLHIDADLSDIGCFSLRPDDFLKLGYGEDEFKNTYQYKASSDIDSLPQIISYDKTIEVYPFWGNQDLCQIGLSRVDFDLSSIGVKIEPRAYLIGGTFSDTGKNTINKNCTPRKKMGRKCSFTSTKGMIETIRFTSKHDDQNRPILEELDTHFDFDESGSYCMDIKMNMDYLITNEFGENEYSNDPNKGVPTSAIQRNRISLKNETLGRVRTTGSYLLPNIREYGNDVEKSYSWSTDYSDYPTDSLNQILINDDGFWYPQDYFYRFTYNKVYTVSSFQNSFFNSNSFTKDKFLAIKEIVPSEEEDCDNSVNTFPVNFGVRNYTFTLLIADILMFLEYIKNLVILIFFNTIANALHDLADAVNFWPIRRLSRSIREFAYRTQDAGQKRLYLIIYPDCDECTGDGSTKIVLNNRSSDYCEVGTMSVISGSPDNNGGNGLQLTGFTFYTGFTGPCSGCTVISDMDMFLTIQTGYTIEYITYNENGDPVTNSVGISYTGNQSYFFSGVTFDPISGTTGVTYNYYDGNQIFTENYSYIITIRDLSHSTNLNPDITIPLEDGCDLYDIPYNSSIVRAYYTCTGGTRCPVTTITGGIDVDSCNLSEDGYHPLPTFWDGNGFTPITESGESEFKNGVFYVVPGTQSNRRISGIVVEHYRRKRVGKLFCGGIVNYTFMDNWLSGSLYFFPFKAKNKKSNSAKYCDSLVKWIPSQSRFYYRSTPYNPYTSTFGGVENNNIYHPTTFVDLGPRDEFIKEICNDESLDPNCSISRQIGETSFQNFGELLGLVINYKMEVNEGKRVVSDFFKNGGFEGRGFFNSLNGDVVQLISTNCEVGIEEFDLQNPKYLGYNYQFLSPRIYPQVFKNGTTVWGPTPITLQLDEDGVRQRACINEGTHIDYNGTYVQGRLTESSQVVPFYLWDKKGTGFGAYNDNTKDDQSWDYGSIVSQPLQGMWQSYSISGVPNDSSDRYLLLPITYTFSGLTIPISGNSTNEIPFDVVVASPDMDDHTNYDTEYPGFQYLYVTSGTTTNPLSGTLYTRYGNAGQWQSQSWNYTMDFIIKRTEDYYTGNKQILSTPFLFYFGLRPKNTGIDKFIERFGPTGVFTTVN